jgi:hypothetical protein
MSGCCRRWDRGREGDGNAWQTNSTCRLCMIWVKMVGPTYRAWHRDLLFKVCMDMGNMQGMSGWYRLGWGKGRRWECRCGQSLRVDLVRFGGQCEIGVNERVWRRRPGGMEWCSGVAFVQQLIRKWLIHGPEPGGTGNIASIWSWIQHIQILLFQLGEMLGTTYTTRRICKLYR